MGKKLVVCGKTFILEKGLKRFDVRYGIHNDTVVNEGYYIYRSRPDGKEEVGFVAKFASAPYPELWRFHPNNSVGYGSIRGALSDLAKKVR